VGKCQGEENIDVKPVMFLNVGLIFASAGDGLLEQQQTGSSLMNNAIIFTLLEYIHCAATVPSLSSLG
jgi:hypothetical protein